MDRGSSQGWLLTRGASQRCLEDLSQVLCGKYGCLLTLVQRDFEEEQFLAGGRLTQPSNVKLRVA